VEDLTGTELRELAYRASDGLEVALVWNPTKDALNVIVSDARTGEAFDFTPDRHSGLRARPASPTSSLRAMSPSATPARAGWSKARTIRSTPRPVAGALESRAAMNYLDDAVVAGGGIALRYGIFYGAANDGLIEPVRKRQFPIVSDGGGFMSWIHESQSELLFASDALLLGRVTYEEFVASWPLRSGDPFTDRMNSLTKRKGKT
jgi:hypothetical protein